MVGDNTADKSIHGKYTRRNVELPPPCSGGHLIDMMNYADEIKDALTMRDVCEMYGVDVNRQGFARCCFHVEKTASMKVYQDGYKCFGCGKSGSVIDFVMEYFRLDFYAACAKINADFGLGFPIGKSLSLREQRQAERAIKERKDQRETEKAKHKALVDDWYRWMGCWELLDGYIRDLAPATPDDTIDPHFVLATKNIAYANYMLDEAEMRLREYEFERSNNRRSVAVVTAKSRVNVLPPGDRGAGGTGEVTSAL